MEIKEPFRVLGARYLEDRVYYKVIIQINKIRI